MKTVEYINLDDTLENKTSIELYSCIQCPLNEFGHFSKSRQVAQLGKFKKIVYLGKLSSEDGYPDIFACYYNNSGDLTIWRGKLNDGVY